MVLRFPCRGLFGETFEKRPLLPNLPPSPKAMVGQAASDLNFDPRNTKGIPVVKMLAFLDLEQNRAFFKGPLVCAYAVRDPLSIASTEDIIFLL
jgi:hypothetical protein